MSRTKLVLPNFVTSVEEFSASVPTPNKTVPSGDYFATINLEREEVQITPLLKFVK